MLLPPPKDVSTPSDTRHRMSQKSSITNLQMYGLNYVKEKHIQVMLILPQLPGTTSFFCVAVISTTAILKSFFFPQRDGNFFFFLLYTVYAK